MIYSDLNKRSQLGRTKHGIATPSIMLSRHRTPVTRCHAVFTPISRAHKSGADGIQAAS